MANVILTGAKTFGQQALKIGGRVALSYANQAITRAFDNRVFEGPRLESLHIQSSRDGAPMARVFGRARIAGQVIWAARVHEHVTEERRGGKGGGPHSRDYTYTISFAVGLCEGEILGVGQIWANGRPLEVKDLNMRLYTGAQDQAPDPLIAEIEGSNVPAFRGTAYMVFEDMPLDEFGARLPQLNFEIIRAPKRTNNEPILEDLVQGVDLIPGSGEFAYGTTIAEERLGPATDRPINMNNLGGSSDIDQALDQLGAQLPNCRSVTLVVSWFGDDLRAGVCQIRPGVENRDRLTKPAVWNVGGETRQNACLISQLDGHPVYGGTPSDASVIEAVQALKARGYAVTLYPFILMDVAADNQLPNPYGGTGQPALPWRGRITCDPAPGVVSSVDKTAQAAVQVGGFFGSCSPNDFSVSGGLVSYTGLSEHSFRRMILHYAHLMSAAGGIDAFIIGSEMRGLTTVRGAGNSYPAVAAFQALAGDVRAVLGTSAKLTYAADWSEYFGHHPDDGSGDVNFHLDPLWADSAIDAVGIDAYFPLADWRDNAGHLDAQVYDNPYDSAYLSANMEGGEGYEWYYASSADRGAQIRTPITDGAANKPWIYRYKDVKSWWANPHFNRMNGQEAANATVWVPQSKPIWFTEIGCPAIDKGANQPNVFYDPKSSESHVPYYSSGARDDLIQRRYVETFLSYWHEDANHNPISTVYNGPMVDMSRAHIWCWDARPFPDFPARTNIWVDGPNWRTGHWLNGRTGLVSAADIVSELCLASSADAPDVSAVLGMVSGYVIGRPMSARAALSPLGIAYDFELVERASGLSFISGGAPLSFVIGQDDLVFAPEGQTLVIKREDTEGRLKDVRLTSIDAGRNYQSASVFARDLLAETVRILDVQIPLVLDPTQAKTMASSLLERSLTQVETIEFTMPQNMLALEVGDVVEIGGADDIWQITSLDGQGTKSTQARRASQNVPLISSGYEPDVSVDPIWVSAPQALILDIPDITGQGLRNGPLVGAVLAPWQPVTITGPNNVISELAAPISTGALLSDLPPGPAGRLWHGAQIDVYLPGALLSSLSVEDVLAGGNMLAVETAQGWEIFQCQNAVLVGDDTYRLGGLLRGQFGTDFMASSTINAGARVVKLPSGWQDLPIDTALRDNDLSLNISANGRAQSENVVFTYAANHLRPLSPAHVKAKVTGVNLEITWIRRTRIGGDDWASLDVPLGEDVERYEIDFMDGETVLLTKEAAEPTLQISISELEAQFGAPLDEITIAVYQLSQTYGRGAGQELTFNIPS